MDHIQPDDNKPNYPLRRVVVGIGAITAAAAAAASLNAGANALRVTPMERYGCQVTADETIYGGENVWDKVATPLAEDMGKSIYTAFAVLRDANPGVNLGDIDANTTIYTVTCEK